MPNDDIQEIKSLLYRSWTAQAMIESDSELQQRLRCAAKKITPTLSQAPCHGSDQDKLSGIVAKIVDLDNKIQDDVNQLVEALGRNRDIINNISDERYKLILTKRYLNHKHWEDIASEMCYRWRGIHKLHIKALVAAKVVAIKLKAL